MKMTSEQRERLIEAIEYIYENGKVWSLTVDHGVKEYSEDGYTIKKCPDGVHYLTLTWSDFIK